MADEILKARVKWAGFVAALVAVGALLGAPAIASAQAGDDDEESDDGETPATGAADQEEDQPDAEAAAEEQADQAEEAAEETAEALSSGDPEQQEEAEEEQAEADDEEAAEEAQAEREPLPWRNSFFSWTHGITPNTFFRDAQLSYNPNYYWWFSLTPRWYLDASTFFFLSQGLFYEFTDDDGTGAYNHDLQLTDTVVELRRTIPWEGFVFIPAVRVLLPASKASQAAQRYFAAAGGLTAVRVIPEAASLTIALVGRYQYWFAGSNVPLTMGSRPGTTAATAPNVPQVNAEGYVDPAWIDQASGVSSARHVITAGLSLTITPFSGFTVAASAFWQSQEGHGLATGCIDVASSSSPECLPDNGPTHWRHFTSLSLSIAYDIQPWFNLSLGWSNATSLAPFFAPDGSVLGPFNPDNNFSLTATFQIDGIYETITTGGEDDGLTPEQRQRRRQGLAARPSSGGSL